MKKKRPAEVTITALIMARTASTRCPQKNIRPFAGTTIIDIALEKLNLCIKIDSARAETYTTLAVYYASNNDYDSARQYVSKGIDINPS